MRKIIPLAFLVLLQTLRALSANAPDYKHHTFQCSLAAGIDHQFVVRKYKDPTSAQLLKDAERPFAGFCFGLHYVYRPIRMFGISTGFESLEFGNKYWKNEYYNYSNQVTVTSVYKGFGFNGSIGVPFFVHFYQQIERITVEVSGGPEFFFNVYSMVKYQVNNYNDPLFMPLVYNMHNTQYFNAAQIKQSSSVAWSLQLLTNIPVTHAFDMAVGPEWKFLDLAQLTPGNKTDFSVPRSVPFFLGVKVCLSLGSNFWKKPDRLLGKK
jgi:hypothetical protein